MAASRMNPVLHHLRRAALDGDAAAQTDGQLLERFIQGRDDTAFATLVRRHGPMVLGLCRRIAGNVHDADDAFQAAFLVLVRKARSVVPREMVGNFLYGVAYHTALKARASAARRRGKEKQVTDMAHPETPTKEADTDLLARLDREVHRLPDKYRLPVVLCELEGRARKEVAAQLGLPEGTLSSRLAKARKLLAQRLGGDPTLGAGVGTAAVSATLLESTVRAAALTAAGRATVDVVSANITLLTEGVLKTMLLTKLKVTAATVLVLGLVLVGGTAGWYGNAVQAQAPAEDMRAQPTKPDVAFASWLEPADKPLPPRRKTDLELLQGTWRVVEFYHTGDSNGQKVTRSLRFDELTAEFKGDKFHVQRNDERVHKNGDATFTLDVKSTPKRMALKMPHEGGELSYTAIYELTGDDLKICMSALGVEFYPTSFDVSRTAAGEFTTLMVLKRAEPVKTPEAAPAKADATVLEALLAQNAAQIKQAELQKVELEAQIQSLRAEQAKLLADQKRLKADLEAQALQEAKEALHRATKAQPNDKAIKTLDEIEKLIQEMKKDLKEKEGRK